MFRLPEDFPLKVEQSAVVQIEVALEYLLLVLINDSNYLMALVQCQS